MDTPVLIEIQQFLDRLPVTVTTKCHRRNDFSYIHNNVQLCYVLSGTLKHTLNDKIYTQPPGSCVTVLPYTLHKIDTSESEDTPVFVLISFFDDFMTDRGYRFFPYGQDTARFEEKSIPALCELSGELHQKGDELVRAMITEFSKEKNISYDRIANLLADLFRIICIDTAPDCDFANIEDKFKSINNAVKYIDLHYSEKITIDDVAVAASMSRSVFTQYFKAVTGMTFAQFLLAFRMRKAIVLILWHNFSLNEVALKTGLNSKANLVRSFSKHFGMPPTRYCDELRPHLLQSHHALQRKWKWMNENQ